MARDRIRRIGSNDLAQIGSMFTLVIGIFLMGLLLLFLIRIQRGLLGLVLAGVAVILMIYWMREIRQLVKKEFQATKPPKKTWTCDVFEADTKVTVVAEVPGPAEDVKVNLKTNSLSIIGGGKFKQKIKISKGLALINTSYLNGVLTVNLKRLSNMNKNSPGRDSLNSKDN
jgi:HSP20 family molecular chaperone IbpA|tara:strand:- start:505 stop:1017 length:513 start_codon:yes stop_codon:yes gene_type:complete